MALTVFGFGSLVNTESLKVTVPDASAITPSYIKGFVRDFSVWDAVGFHDLHETNSDIAGFPYCAMDIKRAADDSARVNGIAFKMSDTHFDELVKREHDYELVKALAYDFRSDELIGECFLFSSNKNNGRYDFDSMTQKRYLQICLQGAREYGERFYQEFLDTTFIETRRLSEIPELITSQLL